jgi:ketosteroid isomerase-like protein
VSETTKSLVADFFATMGAGDWERLRSELLTDESSWTMMAPSLQGGPPPMDSGDAIVAFFSAGGEVFEGGGPEVTIKRILADGDAAAVEAVGNGKLHNGNTYANVYHFAVDTKDGRVVAVREYMDSHHVATVMAPPTPPG